MRSDASVVHTWTTVTDPSAAGHARRPVFHPLDEAGMPATDAALDHWLPHVTHDGDELLIKM
jgi:hypothetical protein